jgi:ketosteroid isomerase-like protein
MSQASNVEVVRRAIDAMNRGVDKNQRAELFAELMTPDFEWLPAMPGAVEGVTYRGREAVETYFDESAEIWEEFQTVIEEFRDLGDRVLTLGHMAGRGAGSGLQIDTPLGQVIDFRDGKISRVHNYLDQGKALRAAGLCE